MGWSEFNKVCQSKEYKDKNKFFTGFELGFFVCLFMWLTLDGVEIIISIGVILAVAMGFGLIELPIYLKARKEMFGY